MNKALKLVSQWWPALIGLCLWMILLQRTVAFHWDEDSIEGMAVYSEKVMWQKEAKEALPAWMMNVTAWWWQSEAEVQACLKGFQEIESEVGVSQSTIDHALMLHGLAQHTSDETHKNAILMKARRLMEKIDYPEGKSVYGNETRQLLSGELLSQDQMSALERLRSDYPQSWTLMHLARSCGIRSLGLETDRQFELAKVVAHTKVLFAIDLTLIAVAGTSGLLLLIRRRQIARWHHKTRRLHRLWRPYRVIFCFGLSSAVAAVLLPLAGRALTLDLHPALKWLCYSALAVLVMGLPIIWLQHFFVRCRRWYGVAIGLDWSDLLRARQWAFSGGVACLIMTLTWLATLVFDQFGMQTSISDGLSRSFWMYGEWGLAISIVLGCIIAPTIEETIFRGFLFSSMRAAWGWKWGALGSSIVFGLSHLYSPAGLASMILMGVGFAWVYHRTGRLVVGMMTHAWINLIISVSDYLWMK